MATVKKVTAGHYLDTRREKIDGTFPVKIRLTYDRKNYFIDSGHSLTPDDYRRVSNGKRLSLHLEGVLADITTRIDKAKEEANKLEYFTWEAFKRSYFKEEVAQPDNLLYVLSEYERELRKDGRIGSADTYRGTIQSLISFLQYKRRRDPFRLQFRECTIEFLKSYQKWLITPRKEGKKEIPAKTLTTVGYHMRNVRVAWNAALRNGTMEHSFYPFGKHRYQIPHTKARKRFLYREELSKLFKYEPTGQEELYYDMWILSYLLAGMNMRDLCQLRYENLDIESGELKRIHYKRAKTIRTRQDGEEIAIPLTGRNKAKAEIIIKKWWRGPDRRPDDYVFSILEKGQDPERHTALVKQFTKMVNKYMGRIAEKIDIRRPTTYHARHSFASQLLINGTSSDMIRPLLGHSNVSTTQNYLRGFPDSVVARSLENLIPE